MGAWREGQPERTMVMKKYSIVTSNNLKESVKYVTESRGYRATRQLNYSDCGWMYELFETWKKKIEENGNRERESQVYLFTS